MNAVVTQRSNATTDLNALEAACLPIRGHPQTNWNDDLHKVADCSWMRVAGDRPKWNLDGLGQSTAGNNSSDF